MRRELDSDLASGQCGEFLVELAKMAVHAAGGIGVEPFRKLGMQQVFLEAAPGPADPGLEIDDDLVEVDHAGGDEWAQRVLPGRRVAARPATSRGADRVAVELGQTVDASGCKLRRGMRSFVPFFIHRRVAQAEIGD